MKIIIDGYNLINTLIDQGLIQAKDFFSLEAREETLELLSNYQASKEDCKMTVVFDSNNECNTDDAWQDIKIIFAAGELKADGAIIEQVDYENVLDPGLHSLELVTNDNEIREYLRKIHGLNFDQKSGMIVNTSDFSKRLVKFLSKLDGEVLTDEEQEDITTYYSRKLGK